MQDSIEEIGIDQRKIFSKKLSRSQNLCANISYCVRQRAVSSVGRAPALQAGCHWFESSTAHFPLISNS